MSDLIWLLLAVLTALDLLFSTVRAGLLNARLPLLMNLAEEQPEPVEHTMTLLEKPRLRTSLRLKLGDVGANADRELLEKIATILDRAAVEIGRL